MTVRKFIDSSIDFSWNNTIYLSYQKIPYEYLQVDIPDDYTGFPYKVQDLLLAEFNKFLDLEITNIISCGPGRALDICIY